MKIGELVSSSIKQLAEKGSIDELELEKLQRLDYCKRTFDANYPVLKEFDHNL
jgi:hypothetical protein